MVSEASPRPNALYISVPEAAQYLGISRKTVYNLIEWGEINAFRVNGAVQIERLSLQSFHESGTLT